MRKGLVYILMLACGLSWAAPKKPAGKKALPISTVQERKQWLNTCNKFLEVKLGIFGTYMGNQEKFPKDMQELNKRAYDYYKMLENTKYFNFKGWKTYHELYKTETLKYYLENFLILNMPLIAKGIFYIRLRILKLLGKRK